MSSVKKASKHNLLLYTLKGFAKILGYNMPTIFTPPTTLNKTNLVLSKNIFSNVFSDADNDISKNISKNITTTTNCLLKYDTHEVRKYASVSGFYE